jgi:signal transduction histidine kinase/DNA-binding response OmpR family regulator
MSLPVLSVEIRLENDTVNARQRARQIARLVGFDPQDQTRIATAVSEIARNAFNYAGGGRIEFFVEGVTRPQLFVIRVADRGRGIPNIDEILEGRYQSRTGMGVGIIGARRLMDRFQIESSPDAGTTIVLTKIIPRRAPLIAEADIARIAGALAAERPTDAVHELQFQNQELLRALEEIRSRQQELVAVNRELEDTNRGVVALYAELDEKADHLRRADELKSKFLSNMSHEFRSPLNSILALTGLLREHADGPLTPEQSQQVEYVRRAAQDLLELVNDLLDLAKVEAGKLEARPVEFEVDRLFAALRGMLRPLLLNRSVDLVFEEANHIPPLYSDEGKISQVLRNFISNALKFTEKGEVRVFAVLTEQDEVAISVSDTGIGIAPADQELIFQDFVQIDHPIQRQVRGTGLGLPLSRKLANFLGGGVEVRSEPGIGSIFTVRVPRLYRDPVQPDAPAFAEVLPDASLKAVLFVENDRNTVLTYRSFLRDSGYQLLHASTTREAKTILETAEPCAIVLDIVLRSEETWSLLAELKAGPRTRHIPVIIASIVEDQAKGFHLGADAYLIKPVVRADLLRHLNRLSSEPVLPRVLIIDDSEADRYVIRQHLRSVPVSVSEESGGLAGVGRASAVRPDLILLDLTMPDMTGFEVLDELKRRPETNTIPVAVITSRVLTPYEKDRLAKSCAALIGKETLSEAATGEAVRRILRIAS